MALNAFTVDVEDWFHICGVDDRLPASQWDRLESRVVPTTRALLDDLAAAGQRGTFLVVGWVAERHPALIREIRDGGHEIGLHGHRHRRIFEMTPEAFRQDLRDNLAALAAAGAGPVVSFRAPEWSLNHRAPWGPAILAEEGLRIDASRAPVARVGSPGYPRRPYPLATPAGALLEVPPLVGRLAGHAVPLGWGWGLRKAAPADVVSAIAANNRDGDPAVLTVHPWELDPAPPHVRLPAPLAFAHYYKLSGFRERLRQVLAGAEFGPLCELPDARAWLAD
ncbi:polysaccharide deacetylase [Luteitalea sp. TBR-22]|uniref:polysaccharide deacetylase family protein n=1 Tax=Luteitalea sp. TBR-22 TaxID=2802971 RepID=UPI001AF71D61|nr:polysaccharide deacetylase family protein [Luteitalea sp. TBR-22]BCS35289.1 polysaccharide deacetylase [Luteitalea sp. TBR-22]